MCAHRGQFDSTIDGSWLLWTRKLKPPPGNAPFADKYLELSRFCFFIEEIKISTTRRNKEELF
jgi:hypothetical protein